MATLAQAFNTFKDNLKVRDGLREQVTARQTRLRQELMARSEVTEVFLSGSWARGTRLEPLNDLDLMMVLKAAPATPADTLAWTCDRLKELYKGTEVRIQARSVGVRFQDFAFDVVPGTPHPQGGYLIPNGQQGWLRTDPKKHQTFAGQRDQATGQMAIPLVKMLKCWRRTHNLQIKNFHLEVLVLRLINGKPDSYAEGARRLFCALPNQLAQPCWDPANFGRLDEHLQPGVISSTQAAAHTAAAHLKEALRLDAAGSSAAAIKLAREVFGSPFPGP